MSTHTPEWCAEDELSNRPDETKPIPLHAEVLAEKILDNAGPGNENPQNFREAWGIVKGHLLQICIAPTGILADGLDATRSAMQGVKKFIKGTAELPEAIASRIRRTTAESEAVENKKQQLLLEASPQPTASLPPPKQSAALPSPKPAAAALPAAPRIDYVALAQAIAELQDVIDDIRAEGGVVEIKMQDDGTCVVILVRPGAEAFAHELGCFLLNESASDIPQLEGRAKPKGELPPPDPTKS